MDEMTELARLRADIPPPSASVLAAARARLIEHDVRPAVLVPRPHRPLRRRALIGIAAAVALGSGAFALTSGGPTSAGSGSAPRAQAPAPITSSSSSSSVVRAPRFVNAAEVLDAVASKTLLAGDPTLAPGQYLYTRVHSLQLATIDNPPPLGAYEFSENTEQDWLPAALDGVAYSRSVSDISVSYPSAAQRRRAAKAPGGVPSRTVAWSVTKGSGETVQVYPAPTGPAPKEYCQKADGTITQRCPQPLPAWDLPNRASLATLPTEPAALRASLFTWATNLHAEATKAGKPTTLGSLALGGISAVLDTNLAPAKLRAALFQVAKTIPGITLTGSMANYDGRRGLGVGVTDQQGVQDDLIFDPATGSYLGERAVVTRPGAAYQLKAGTVIGWTAVTRGVAGKPALPTGAQLPR